MLKLKIRAIFKKIFPQEIQTKLYRYAGVSIFNIIVTQFLLWIWSRLISGVLANVVAVCLAAIPAFFLYKHWVWKHSENSAIRKEVLFFWLMAMIGLGFSTLAVWIATQWWDNFWSLGIANITGYGILWIGRFVFFETYLFKGGKFKDRNLKMKRNESRTA